MMKYKRINEYDASGCTTCTEQPHLVHIDPTVNTFDYLEYIKEYVTVRRYSKKVLINESISNKEIQLPISKYLTDIFQEEAFPKKQPNQRMCHWKCPELFDQLELSFQKPSYCHSWLDAEKSKWFPYWKWVIIGPRYAVTPLHTDILNSSAWNLLLSGLKIWILIPPSSPVKGRVLLEDKSLCQKDYAKHIRVALQRPNDLIWVPPGWQHEVYYLQSSICITENIINHTSIAPMLDYLEKYPGTFKIKLKQLQEAFRRNR